MVTLRPQGRAGSDPESRRMVSVSWPSWAAPSIARAGGRHVAGGDVEAAPRAPAPVVALRAACLWQPWFVVGALSFTRGRPIKQGLCTRRVNVSWLLAVGFMVCEPAELHLLPGGRRAPITARVCGQVGWHRCHPWPRPGWISICPHPEVLHFPWPWVWVLFSV